MPYIVSHRPAPAIIHAWAQLALYFILAIAGGAFGAWLNDRETMVLMPLIACAGIVALMVVVDARSRSHPHEFKPRMVVRIK